MCLERFSLVKCCNMLKYHQLLFLEVRSKINKRLILNLKPVRFAFTFDITYSYFNFSIGSACSHLAGLLFKLEACVRLQLNKKSVTSQLCQWSRCRKRAEPALLLEINFKRPRKGHLPEEAKTSRNVKQRFSVRSPVGILDKKLAQLRKFHQMQQFLQVCEVVK